MNQDKLFDLFAFTLGILSLATAIALVVGIRKMVLAV